MQRPGTVSFDEEKPSSEIGPYLTRGIRYRELTRSVETLSPKTLLVMGCGNGYLESTLSDNIRSLSVDTIESDLDIARTLNKDKPHHAFRLLDLFDVPQNVAPGSFDCVVISEVIEHVEDDLQAVRIACDSLRPGGTFFLTAPNIRRFQNMPRRAFGRLPKFMSVEHLREYTRRDVLDLVRRAGFVCDGTRGLDFWFPKDPFVQTVIPFGSAPRRWLGEHLPDMATWHMLVCRKPAT